jgi:hypothetical protein
VDLTELVLDDGTMTRAQGRVIVHEGKTWFEPMGWFDHVHGAPHSYGVPVLGVEMDTLSRRGEEKDAGVEGYATLAGIWAEDALVVSHQAAPGLLPEHHAERPARPEKPWPASDAEAAYDDVKQHMREWLVYEIGQTQTWDGLLTLTAKVVRILPGFVDWARPLPDGMLTLDVWLAPHPHAL